ncbi:hypothetical protein JCM16358_15310 [Halanaerocella petrolearia]
MNTDNQKEEITFKFIPHTSQGIFTLRLSKKFIKVTLTFMLIGLLTLVGGLYYYHKQYNLSLKRIKQYIPLKEKNKELRKSNNHLHQKLAKLSKQTEKIKQEFNRLKKENQKIRQLVDFKDQLNSQAKAETVSVRTVSYNSNQNSIKRAEDNLQLLKEALPQGEKNVSQLKEEVVEYKDYLVSKPHGWPIKGDKGRITSAFGYRHHPVLNKRVFHDGLDIGIWYNHKVVATGKGKVIFAGKKSGYGNAVVIAHGYNYRTLYGHNKRLLVKAGDRVERGDVIALSGNSGRSTGPHLHYEILLNRRPVDPMDYIK